MAAAILVAASGGRELYDFADICNFIINYPDAHLPSKNLLGITDKDSHDNDYG